MKVSIFKSAPTGDSAAARPRAGQSIRGRISGPIPIVSPVDEEFPIRNPGAAMAMNTAGETQDNHHQRQHLSSSPHGHVTPAATHVPRPDVAYSHYTSSGSDSGKGCVVPAAPSTRREALALSPPSGPLPPVPRGPPQGHRRADPSSTVRYSVVSEATQATESSRGTPQRKKSTFRGAFSKLFGRRKKSEGNSFVSSQQRISAVNGRSQQQSDPPPMARERKESESKRSASFPITEFDRALRSHSVGPRDIRAIEGVRNSMHGEFGLAARRRATITTSQVFRSRDGELAGLSPRPVSTHARGSRLFATGEDPSEIGRAITSDTLGHRRRSRSLNGLHDVEGREVRRRSDEIRYWRQSRDAFLSPTLTVAPQHDPDDDHDEGRDTPTDVSAVQDEEKPPETPAQPFNFGDLTHLNPTAGMKITQSVSLEARIDHLEVRMVRMERLATHLCDALPGFQLPPELRDPPDRPSPAILTTGATSPEPSAYLKAATPKDDPGSSPQRGISGYSGESHVSLAEGPNHVSSTQLSAPSFKQRPTSGVTIRETVNHSATSQDVDRATMEQQTMLLAHLEAERASRQVLEERVAALTSSLNSLLSRHHSTHFQPPPTARSFGQVSVFHHDDSDEENGAHSKHVGHVGPEDSGLATGSTTGGEDDYSEEPFETPRERLAFGQEDTVYQGDTRDDDYEDGDDDENLHQKAPRTMSLGQLTLGRAYKAPRATAI